MSGCGDDHAAKAKATATPMSETEILIRKYDKASKEYGRVARKIKGGDVSLTVRYIESGRQIRELSARLDQQAAALSPSQKQRVAAISATNAPYLQP